jgi:hypothetical protein
LQHQQQAPLHQQRRIGPPLTDNCQHILTSCEFVLCAVVSLTCHHASGISTLTCVCPGFCYASNAAHYSMAVEQQCSMRTGL